MRGFFSAEQQAVLRDGPAHRLSRPTERHVKAFRDPSVPGLPFALAYEGGSPDEVVIVTTIAESPEQLRFDDLSDLGPVGRFLHGWNDVERPYPTQPMVMRRDQYHSYRHGNLPAEQILEACAAARDRARANAEDAPYAGASAPTP